MSYLWAQSWHRQTWPQLSTITSRGLVKQTVHEDLTRAIHIVWCYKRNILLYWEANIGPPIQGLWNIGFNRDNMSCLLVPAISSCSFLSLLSSPFRAAFSLLALLAESHENKTSRPDSKRTISSSRRRKKEGAAACCLAWALSAIPIEGLVR